jgi:myo-inositol-1(or 4)-monophosphatase
MMPSSNGAALGRLATDIARRAGALISAGRANGPPPADTKSSATDMVTQYDKASERLIVDAILRERPDDGIVGEEGTDVSGTSGVRWIIDPIDGTTNYLYDLPGYAVSIAAADHHGVIAGAVYLPSADEMFTAVRGGGAALNGETISCGDTTLLSAALVATGFGYHPERRTRQTARLLALIADIRDIRRLGAASADLCHLACGRVDVYYEQYLNEWDDAAGTLIAAEAGAVVGRFPGFATEPDGLLVANPALYPQMLQALTAITVRGDRAVQPPSSGIM